MPLTLTFISLLLMLSNPFDTVDRGILDRVLTSLGLPGCGSVIAYFEYHASCSVALQAGIWTLGSLGPGLGGIHSGLPFEHDVHCCLEPA